MEHASKKTTLSKALNNIIVHRKVARDNAIDAMCVRLGIQRKELDGIHYRLEERTDNLGDGEFIEIRAYKLVDAAVITLQTQLKIVTEEGIDQISAIKLKPNNDRAADPEKNH